MRYTRVLIAKVALRVATEDEVFWVSRCIAEGCGCEKDIQTIRTLAELPSTPLCVGDAELIRMADTVDMSNVPSVTKDHIVSCERCAKIGHYIANMANPENEFEAKSLAG